MSRISIIDNEPVITVGHWGVQEAWMEFLNSDYDKVRINYGKEWPDPERARQSMNAWIVRNRKTYGPRFGTSVKNGKLYLIRKPLPKKI